MGTPADAGQAELLFDLLENDGAARITLGPLDLAAQDRAVTELAPSAPQAAAEPATGALALTLPCDPAGLATVITAAAVDATRMCDVPPRRRSAVWEAMPTRAEG